MTRICFIGLENLPILAAEYGGLGSGGEQLQQTLLATALARRGYEVSMVVGDYGQADGAAWSGVTTHKAYSAKAGIPVLRFIHPRLTGLWRAMQRANADVYYCSCAGMHVGIAAVFGRMRGKRIVFRTAHDRDCLPDQLLIKYGRDKALYRYGVAHVDAILTQSVRQQQDMRQHFGRESTVAGMLVEWPADLVPRDEREHDVVWVNNIRDFKRPDVYLDLAQAMPARRFIMIGGQSPGSEKLFRSITDRARGIPNLRFLGAVPYHEVNRYYAHAKVFVNTSDSEGFPNSFLQSWVRGTPVVSCFDPDGVIGQRQMGWRASDLADMVTAIDRLLDDPAAWAAASGEGLRYMREHFDEATILAPYVAALTGA